MKQKFYPGFVYLNDKQLIGSNRLSWIPKKILDGLNEIKSYKEKAIKSNVFKSELKNLNNKITNFISIELKELEQKINELEKFVKSSKEIVKNVKEEMEKLKNELLNENSFDKNKIEHAFQSKEKIIMDLKLNPLLLKEKEKEKMISVIFSSFEGYIQYIL